MKEPAVSPVFTVGACSTEQRRVFLDAVIPALLQQGLQAGLLFSDFHLQRKLGLESYSRNIFSCPAGPPLELFLRERARQNDLLFYFEADRSKTDFTTAGIIDVSSFMDSFEGSLARLLRVVDTVFRQREIWACILIGGRSSRMGRPKHLLKTGDGLTWLERSVGVIDSLTAGVVLSGRGGIPGSLAALPRLPDVPGIEGPLAGLTAAARWQPDVAWLVVACDMPGVTAESVAWLLDNRRPGVWGIVPRSSAQQRLEPLFALYEPQAGLRFETMQLHKNYRIRGVMECGKVRVADIPESLQSSWQNVNTPEELRSIAENGVK